MRGPACSPNACSPAARPLWPGSMCSSDPPARPLWQATPVHHGAPVLQAGPLQAPERPAHTGGGGGRSLSASAGLVLYHLPSPTGPIDMQCEPRGGQQLEGTLRGARPCPAVQQAAALPSCQAWSWGSGNKSEAALVWEDGQSCTGKPAPPADGRGWGVSRWGETALPCRAGGSGPAALRPSG